MGTLVTEHPLVKRYIDERDRLVGSLEDLALSLEETARSIPNNPCPVVADGCACACIGACVPRDKRLIGDAAAKIRMVISSTPSRPRQQP